MRIIAGEFRGRPLLAPEGDRTRPITDRVKQSLFDILAAQIPGTRIYDCFAGTGSMGLESLSRGAAHVTFFETDRSAATRLRRNIETLGVGDRSTLVTQDLFRWFDSAAAPAEPVELIFLDPPYRLVRERPEALRRLARQARDSHLAPGGTLVFRHDAADRLELPAVVRYDQRTYGGMTVELLHPAPA